MGIRLGAALAALAALLAVATPGATAATGTPLDWLQCTANGNIGYGYGHEYVNGAGSCVDTAGDSWPVSFDTDPRGAGDVIANSICDHALVGVGGVAPYLPFPILQVGGVPVIMSLTSPAAVTTQQTQFWSGLPVPRTVASVPWPLGGGGTLDVGPADGIGGAPVYGALIHDQVGTPPAAGPGSNLLGAAIAVETSPPRCSGLVVIAGEISAQFQFRVQVQ